MLGPRQLPRAIPGTTVALDSAVYNALIDAVDRANKMAFVAPLYVVSDGPAGKVVGCQFSAGNAQIPGQVTSIISGAGEYYNGTYSGGYGTAGNAFTSAANLTDAQLGITNTSSACTIINVGAPDDWSHHMLPIPSGDADDPILMLTPTGQTDPNKSYRPIFLVTFTSDLYYCALSETSGSNGTQTSAASYQYTMTNVNGETLGTGVSPATTRANGTCTQATYGWTRWNGSAWILVWCNEAPGTTASCT